MKSSSMNFWSLQARRAFGRPVPATRMVLVVGSPVSRIPGFTKAVITRWCVSASTMQTAMPPGCPSGQTRPYRLLSEAEWEYVRRGTTGPSDAAEGGPAPLSDDGNFRWDGWVASTTPAGRYASNNFDVHDMMGNAGEWTADCWHDDPGTVPANGRARLSSGDCSAHAVRGGSWDDHAENSRPASRQKVQAGTRDWRIGFRVMRPASEDLPISQ